MAFFKNIPGVLDFQLYGKYHFLAIFVLILLGTLIYIFRNQLRNEQVDFKVRTIASIIVFTMEIGYHVSNYIYDTDFVYQVIPLHLCSLTLWLALAVNLTKNRVLFNILYFWGIGGIVTFIYPDIIGIGPDKMRYYQFFADHAYIVLTVVYFLVVYGYRIRFKAFLQAFATLFPITLVVRAIDLQFFDKYHFNWMYMAAPPEFDTILNLFPTHGWGYYFSIASIGIVAFLIAYVPWGVVNGVKIVRERIAKTVQEQELIKKVN